MLGLHGVGFSALLALVVPHGYRLGFKTVFQAQTNASGLSLRGWLAFVFLLGGALTDCLAEQVVQIIARSAVPERSASAQAVARPPAALAT